MHSIALSSLRTSSWCVRDCVHTVDINDSDGTQLYLRPLCTQKLSDWASDIEKTFLGNHQKEPEL